MRARWLGLVLAGCTVAVALLPARAAETLADGDAVPGRAVVRFARDATPAQRTAAIASVHGSVEREIPTLGYALVRFADAVPVRAAVVALRAQPGVASASPNSIGRIAEALPLPNDACVSSCSTLTQWDIGAVNALGGWRRVAATYPTALSRAGTNPVKVAVLDTKIAQTHPDFISAGGSRVNGYDVANGGMLDLADAKDYPTDPAGTWAWHGTFVAGIAGAAVDNTSAVAGFGFTAQLMPITVVNGDGTANAFDVADGISWAVAHGARVLNLSLAFATSDPVLRDAVAAASSAGALVVAAAGNNGGSSAAYPAWYPSVMSVTATRDDDLPASCSNHSVHTSVAAPGDGIVSLDRSGSWMRGPCGTSAATPHVSALAALLLAQDPGRSPATVRSIIEQTADDASSDLFAGRDDYFGYGRINFDRALGAASAGLPQVLGLDVSFAQVQAGTFHAPWHARASASVDGAEWFLDDLGEPGSGSPAAVSGSALSGDVAFSSTPASGVHRVFVRAHNASLGWGPASVAALVVDRRAPGVAINPPPLGTYVGLGGVQSVPVSATITDDRSPTATVVMTVWQRAGDVVLTAYTSAPAVVRLLAQNRFQFDWTPQATDAGAWNITLTVTDRGGNVSAATTPVVVV